MRKWMDIFIVSPRDKTIEPRPKLPLKLDVLWLWELFEIATRWSSFAMALSHMNSESSQQVSSHICCVWSSDIDTSVEREKRCQYVSGLLRFPSAAQYMRSQRGMKLRLMGVLERRNVIHNENASLRESGNLVLWHQLQCLVQVGMVVSEVAFTATLWLRY